MPFPEASFISFSLPNTLSIARDFPSPRFNSKATFLRSPVLEYLFLTSSSETPYAPAIAFKASLSPIPSAVLSKAGPILPRKKYALSFTSFPSSPYKKLAIFLTISLWDVMFSSSSKRSASSMNRAITLSPKKRFEIFLYTIIQFAGLYRFAPSNFRNRVFPLFPMKQLSLPFFLRYRNL